MAGTNIAMVPSADGRDELGNVRAICHSAGQTETYQAALVHLYSMAKSLFVAQVLRLYVYGILSFGTTVEVWAFDRSGMYCSEPLRLIEHGSKLASIMCALNSMPDSALGLSELLKEYGDTRCQVLQIAGDTLFLHNRPIVSRDGLLTMDCAATFRARQPRQNGQAL